MIVYNSDRNYSDFGIDNLRFLVSYQTCVGMVKDGVVYVTKKTWSNTTSRQLRKWLINFNHLQVENIEQHELDVIYANL